MPEDGDPCLAGQARRRIRDATATKGCRDVRGEGRELDQLTFLELRVGGDERMTLASEITAPLEERRRGFDHGLLAQRTPMRP